MNVILVGGFSEVIELANSNDVSVIGVIDVNDTPDISKYKLKYLGGDEVIETSLFKGKFHDTNFFLCQDGPVVRRKLFLHYESLGYNFMNILSNNANISKTSSIKPNSSIMIQDLVNISANVKIDRGVRINTAANVMHDCILEAFVTIAPNAVLLGRVRVGEGTYIGANATILPGLNIGENAVVGAGAVVTKDIANNEVVVGNPARKLNKK